MGLAFRPDMVSGLNLWIDAAAVPGLHLADVGTIVNKSPLGTAANATQATTANKPQLFSGGNGQNGHNLLNFVSGGAGNEKFVSGACGSITDAISIFYVARETTEVSYNTVVGSGGLTGTTGIAWVTFLSNGAAAGMGAGGTAANVLFPPAAGAPDSNTYYYQAYRLSGGTWTLDGFKAFSIADASAASGTFNYTVGVFDPATQSNPSACYIAEILIYSKSVTDQERNNIKQYLQTKWSAS